MRSRAKKICLSTVLVALLSCISSKAQESGSTFVFEYGVEWGYTATVFRSSYLNYISPQTGSRVDGRDAKASFKSNGLIKAYAGVELGRYWNADLFAGYCGIYEGRNMIPVSLRVSLFPKGRGHGSMKIFAEGGVNFGTTFRSKAVPHARIGFGGRIELARRVSGDWTVSASATLDHPAEMQDDINHRKVDESMLLKSDVIYAGITLSMSLNFK